MYNENYLIQIFLINFFPENFTKFNLQKENNEYTGGTNNLSQ